MNRTKMWTGVVVNVVNPCAGGRARVTEEADVHGKSENPREG